MKWQGKGLHKLGKDDSTNNSDDDIEPVSISFSSFSKGVEEVVGYLEQNGSIEHGTLIRLLQKAHELSVTG